MVLPEAGSVVYLAAMRPRHNAPFGADEMARLRPLLAHLEQAVRLHRRLTLLESERNEAKHALDLLPTGILFVGDNGEILMANRRAREILEAGEGLIVRRGRMQAEDREESERLRAMIAGAAQTARGRGTRAGGAMAVSRRSRARSLSVLISPMRTTDPMLARNVRPRRCLWSIPSRG